MSQIQFFENVFEERFCTFLLANARARLSDSSEFARSNFHWMPSIRNASAAVLVRDYDEKLARLILDALLTRQIIDNDRYGVMNYAWTKLSYIPWHHDQTHTDALTIYLNDNWDMDWGGLFLFKENDGPIQGFAPRFNCAVKNSANVAHCTTPVNLDAPEPRFTIQLFSKA